MMRDEVCGRQSLCETMLQKDYAKVQENMT